MILFLAIAFSDEAFVTADLKPVETLTTCEWSFLFVDRFFSRKSQR